MRPSEWPERLLGAALMILAASVALSFAVSLVEPLLPLIVFSMCIGGFVAWQRR